MARTIWNMTYQRTQKHLLDNLPDFRYLMFRHRAPISTIKAIVNEIGLIVNAYGLSGAHLFQPEQFIIKASMNGTSQ